MTGLLAETMAGLTSLNDENKTLDWIGWRGSREQVISELVLLSHEVETTGANSYLVFARLKNATDGLEKASATCR